MIDVRISGFTGQIDQHASSCCICNHHMVPLPLCGSLHGKATPFDFLEICYRCTNIKCQSLFISVFEGHNTSFGSATYYDYCGSKPKVPVKKEFSEAINTKYPRFVDIYNQAYSSEQYELLDVCGPGYRKALEFLIKTYLIAKSPEKEKGIKEAQLGNCISNFVQNENVKVVAARAAWLGNDETHFVRKWADKDIEYLKGLIQLTVNWLDMEHMTETVVFEMPQPEKPPRAKK